MDLKRYEKINGEIRDKTDHKLELTNSKNDYLDNITRNMRHITDLQMENVKLQTKIDDINNILK